MFDINHKKHGGFITILVLVFGSIFLVLLAGLAGFVLTQHKLSLQKAAYEQALGIAEAGLNYYRWHLAHDPDDLTDGTGGPGPYIHNYSDPEGGVVGQFSLDISGEEQCGQTSGVKIASTGWTSKFPEVKRTVNARYVRPTVADYSFLINDNVWAGADREIKGPYHSNGGIRMDGENNSLVTSARETWLCTASFGCNPPQEKPGVFGSGENSDLWRFPVPPFDFNGITMDLARMKSLTKEGSGLYFPPSETKGYHVILKADRSIDVYKVNKTKWVWAYDLENSWHHEYSVIDKEEFIGNFLIPSECGLIFIEDNLWVSSLNEGSKVKGKITLVSADLENPSKDTNVWLNGSIEYTTRDGSDGFTLVSQNNNLIALYVPDIMILDGVYIAQNGRYGRNHYPSWYNPYHKRQKLEIFGSIVSNGRVGTKWTSGGVWISGFNKRETTYDPDLSFSPPPFLPAVSEEYIFKNWEEF